LNPAGTVCLVSHDAGGAELLATYAAQNGLRCRFVLEGPAVKVFERHLGAVPIEPLAQAIAASDWCLCGTSWQSDLEWCALGEAKRAGKRTASFLDHWVNYPERFERGGTRRLPDELWVGDDEAQALARGHFPDLPLRLVPNPWFRHVREEVARIEARESRRRAGSVLFVCDNLSGHARLRFGDERHWGYTEFDALDYFFSRLGTLGSPVTSVTLRPHPSDPKGKYDAVLAAQSPLARLSGGGPLLEEIAASETVAGCESMAMVAALIAGRRVLCAIPPGCSASFIDRRPGVEMLRDLRTVSDDMLKVRGTT